MTVLSCCSDSLFEVCPVHPQAVTATAAAYTIYILFIFYVYSLYYLPERSSLPDSKYPLIQRFIRTCSGEIIECFFGHLDNMTVHKIRSEETRVGKEWVSSGRYRWWPDHEK